MAIKRIKITELSNGSKLIERTTCNKSKLTSFATYDYTGKRETTFIQSNKPHVVNFAPLLSKLSLQRH